jgi:hypothetical protein
MPLVAFDYRFVVGLPASADEAYRWATDYAPDDPARMGQVGRRRIDRLAEGTIVLTDTVRRDGRSVTKKRLVRLRPRFRAWTNTHLAGPTRHSQFLYRIVPRGPRRSALEFIGLQVERASRPLSPSQLARRAREVAREDAATWRRLARAMASDLARARTKRRRGPRA